MWDLFSRHWQTGWFWPGFHRCRSPQQRECRQRLSQYISHEPQLSNILKRLASCQFESDVISDELFRPRGEESVLWSHLTPAAQIFSSTLYYVFTFKCFRNCFLFDCVHSSVQCPRESLRMLSNKKHYNFSRTGPSLWDILQSAGHPRARDDSWRAKRQCSEEEAVA